MKRVYFGTQKVAHATRLECSGLVEMQGSANPSDRRSEQQNVRSSGQREESRPLDVTKTGQGPIKREDWKVTSANTKCCTSKSKR